MAKDKDKMPDLKNSQMPRVLDVKKFTEDSEVEPPPFQAWRHEGFVVVYPEGAPGCMAASLDGETFLQRIGPPAMIFAMIDALYGIKQKGERLFPTYRSLSDDEFFKQGMAALVAYMALHEVGEDDEEVYEDIYQAAREDVLSQLIKPPKKD
jgi:hypothetical protein